MKRIQHATAVASEPSPGASGTTGFFTEGNPGTGTPATVVSDDWLNDVQEELVGPIVLAGLTPTAGVRQLLAALYKLMTPTGTVMAGFWTAPPPGWIMMNDGTIGSAASTATNRANADTVDLFTLLWNNVANNWAPVGPGGRGASAAADFAANKTITLPKSLGRALANAGAGAGLTSRVLGQTLGEEVHFQTIGEMPPHDHDLVTFQSGAAQTVLATASAANTAIQKTLQKGLGNGFNVMQPTSFLNFMIKL